MGILISPSEIWAKKSAFYMAEYGTDNFFTQSYLTRKNAAITFKRFFSFHFLF